MGRRLDAPHFESECLPASEPTMKITKLSPEELSRLKEEKDQQLYVRDEEYGWLPASFLERGDESLPDRIKVQVGLPRDWLDTTVSTSKDYSLLNKCKRWVAKDDVVVVPSTSRTCEQVRDVLCMDELHEASLLYLLKQRHGKKRYYTRMGSILLSLNPLQDADNSLELQRTYAKSFVWQGTHKCLSRTF
jgi:myosin heavy subunit